MPLQLDTGEKGLAMFFKDWQIEILRYLWSIHPEGAKSRTVHEKVNKPPEATISRASVINYLNAMADEGFLGYTDNTGKGGHHRVYTAAHTEDDFKRRVAEIIVTNLLKEYPLETRKAIQQL